MTHDKINIYRIQYRLTNNNMPLIAEIIIKSKKSQAEIKFAETIKKYWENNKTKMKLDEILFIHKIGEE